MLKISTSLNREINIAEYMNGFQTFVNGVIIENDSDTCYKNVKFEIDCIEEDEADKAVIPFVLMLDEVPAHGKVSVNEAAGAELNINRLTKNVNIRTEIQVIFRLSTTVDGVIHSQTEQIVALPPNFCHFETAHKEVLAAHINPNSRCVKAICKKAAGLLKERTGSDSMTGYQDNARVVQMAEAIFDTIKTYYNISYFNLEPSNFCLRGQLVLPPHMIVEKGLESGNCADNAFLLAACLECVGLMTGVIIEEDHAIVFVRRSDVTFSTPVVEDPDVVKKELALEVGKDYKANSTMFLVECTFMNANSGGTFQSAMTAPYEKMCKDFRYLVDVVSARRKFKIKPLNYEPLDVVEDGERDGHDEAAGKKDPFVFPEDVDADEMETLHRSRTKVWERELLPMTLRNPLINAGFGKKTFLPVLFGAMEEISTLKKEETYELVPMSGTVDAKSFEDLANVEYDSKLDIRENRIRVALSEKELATRTKAIHKAAREDLEERGTSTLFLSVGLMKWYDGKDPHFAPILLYPCESTMGVSSCRITLHEDATPRLNPALLEKLARDFKVQMPFKDEELPKDEAGNVDIPKILATLNKAIKEAKGWMILKSVAVGVFSTDIVLWHDIHSNEEILHESKLTGALIRNTPLDQQEQEEFRLGIPTHTRPMPIVADSSQEFAIEASMKEMSFCIEGPPGCGKSQVITGIIGLNMAQGKTINFVCEKHEALKVVKSRLDKMNLGEFCVDLHSANTPKATLLEALGKVIELANSQQEDDSFDTAAYALKLEEFMELKNNLNLYVEALHAKGHNVDMSVIDLMDAYEAIPKDLGAAVDFDPEELPDAEDMDVATIAKYKDLLERTGDLVAKMDVPLDRHPLRNYTGMDYNHSTKNALATNVRMYRKALDQLDKESETFANCVGFSKPTSLVDIKDYYDLACSLRDLDRFPKNWRYNETEESLTEMKLIFKAFAQEEHLEKKLLASFDESILDEPVEPLMKTYELAVNGPKLVRSAAMNHLLKVLGKHSRKEPVGDHRQLRKTLEELQQYRRLQEQNDRYLDTARAFAARSYGDDTPAFAEVYARLEECLDLLRGIRELPDGNGEILLRNYMENEAYPAVIKRFSECCDTVGNLRSKITKFLKTGPEVLGDDWIAGEKSHCDKLEPQIEHLSEWTVFNSLCAEMEEAGLQIVEDSYRQGLDPKAVNASFFKSLYCKMICSAIDDSPLLSCFSGAIFSNSIEKLRRADEAIRELTLQDLRKKLIDRARAVLATAKEQPGRAFPVMCEDGESADSHDITELIRVIKAKGKGLTMRKIFENYMPMITELTPCLMMSPESVATFCKMEEIFDLCIYDEASQLTTARAAGSLARAKNAIVCGDSKQMPPSRYFMSDNYEEENWQNEDLESLLDDFTTLTPITGLRWHYRSSHDSLIEFSNHRFYDGKLVSFPSTDRTSHVTYHYVADGAYDSGSGKDNSNIPEAMAVVKALKEFSRNEATKDLSYGIVAFNQKQQFAIRKLVDEAATKDPAFSKWLATATEPLFVKNLESSQGDERDVLFISTTYGPNKTTGKFSLNMGPLNMEGGWRRLNVCITRARERVEVFSSIQPTMIELDRTQARGVHELRAFLEYAQGKDMEAVSENKMTYNKAPTPIAKAIGARLEAEGYKVVYNVGSCSALTVDIGVVHPENESTYLMAILLDGKRYASAKTTRDREIGIPDVLDRMQWNVYRINSVEWFGRKEEVMKDLLKTLNIALHGKKEGETDTAESA